MNVMEERPSSRSTSGPPSEMDTGRPGTGPEPAFHVRPVEEQTTPAHGAR